MSSGRGASKHNRSFVNGCVTSNRNACNACLSKSKPSCIHLPVGFSADHMYRGLEVESSDQASQRGMAHRAWGPYNMSPSIGKPACAKWTRIWCVRPVFGDANTSAAIEIGFHSSVSFHSLFELSAPCSKSHRRSDLRFVLLRRCLSRLQHAKNVYSGPIIGPSLSSPFHPSSDSHFASLLRIY